MGGTGMSNSWFINRNNSSVGVSNKLGVQVKGTSISISGSITWSISSITKTSSNNWGSSSISNSLGGKMVSTGSSNSWLIKRNNSSVGMSNKLCVQVKRTGVTIRSISGISKTSSNRGRSSISGVSVSSTISWSITSIAKACSKLCSKMLSPGSSNCWLINRCYGSIGMGLKTEESLGSGSSNTGGENQKLHICRCGALELK